MSKPLILIMSAAGNTGIPTVLQLREQGYPVRAFVRRIDDRSERLRQAGADIFVGNMADARDLRKAMAGVQRAYFCAPVAANGLLYSTVFALAAQEAQLEHIVAMSQWLSSETHPSLATRETSLADRIFPQLTGASHTTINVGWFAENYFFVLETMAQLGLMPMPLGNGLNAPPSNEDIARVIVGSLINPELHAGKTYRPTGPELLTPQQIVDHIGDALGRKVKYRPMSEKMFLKALQADGFPVFAQTQLLHYLEDYRSNAFGIGAPTDAVAHVAGTEPEDFATISRRYVASRPEAQRTAGNKLRAIRKLAKMVITRPINPAQAEQSADHALLKSPTLATDSATWMASHDLPNGFGSTPTTHARAEHVIARIAG